MFSSIKAFFEEKILAAPSDTDGKECAFRLATTALLIEMMRMDDHFHETEQQVLAQQIKTLFSLSEEETDQLVKLASSELKQATDYYQFTSLINQNFEYEEKLSIIEALWQVAYADNDLDIDEEYLVRKISELLYISHSDFIAIKLRVKNK